LEVGPARRSALPEGRRVKKEYRDHRVYKYMHIYLCTILTIRFLEVGPAWRAALAEERRVKKEYRVKSKIGYQDVDIRISEYEVAVPGTPP